MLLKREKMTGPVTYEDRRDRMTDAVTSVVRMKIVEESIRDNTDAVILIKCKSNCIS